MKPNKRNFCGGGFPDWLEVMLIDKCNGACSWCIERGGWHPNIHVDWFAIGEAALAHGALNIILLGGEPTLYRDLMLLIRNLANQGRRVWITTNGSLLTRQYVSANLPQIFGVNISIHHYDMARNTEITGVSLKNANLIESIEELLQVGAVVRLNCNCIKGAIDSVSEITQYVEFAKGIGADKVRFAELKQDEDQFVDLAKSLDYKYGLNDNPFLDGCNSDAVINGMPVNFRQMCGLQTSRRDCPKDPEQIMKEVLYYDGHIYDGWQIAEKETIMDGTNALRLLQNVASGTLLPTEALALLGFKKMQEPVEKEAPKQHKAAASIRNGGGGGCMY